MLGQSCRPLAQFPDLETLFQNTRAWGGVLAVIHDHRHRGNLHIKSWLSTGPLPMLQEAAVPGRQACIGMYHEPYQAARQGPSRGVQESLVAGQHQPVPASQDSQGAGACGSRNRTRNGLSAQQRAQPRPHCHSRKSSLKPALDVLETACSLGVVAGCHIRAAPGGSTGATPAATLNPGRGSNVVRSLVQLITSTNLIPAEPDGGASQLRDWTTATGDAMR